MRQEALVWIRQGLPASLRTLRDESGIKRASNTLLALKEACHRVTVDDKGKIYNTELMEALELEHMLDVAEVVAHGALAREESRGTYLRNDFQKRDDAN